MYYLGIDIGKNNHEAGLIREDGSHVGKSLRFANAQEGFQQLLLFLEQSLPEREAFCIGMEATGHYWLALYSFLREQGFALHVINPIQSDSLRNFHIRKQKTDAVDCFLVAEVIRFGSFSATHLADEDIMALRNLARFRESLKDSCADYKRQVVTVLDQVFPVQSQETCRLCRDRSDFVSIGELCRPAQPLAQERIPRPETSCLDVGADSSQMRSCLQSVLRKEARRGESAWDCIGGCVEKTALYDLRCSESQQTLRGTPPGHRMILFPRGSLLVSLPCELVRVLVLSEFCPICRFQGRFGFFTRPTG